MTQDDPKVEISAIKAQLSSIQKAIDEVKVAVTDMVRIGTSVAVMKEQQETHADKISELTKRLDSVEARLTNNSAYINKLRGGFSLTVTLVTLIQGAVIAGASWILVSVIDARESITAVQQTLRHIELEQTRIIQAFLEVKDTK